MYVSSKKLAYLFHQQYFIDKVRCSNFCLKLKKGIKYQGVNNFNFHASTLYSLDSLYPIMLTGAKTQSEGEAEENFSEETIVCGNGRDGFLLWSVSDDGSSGFGLFVCGRFVQQAGNVKKSKENTDIV